MGSLLGARRSTPSFAAQTTSPIKPSRKSGYLHCLIPPLVHLALAAPFKLGCLRKGEPAIPLATSALVALLPFLLRGELEFEKPWSDGDVPAE